MNVRPRRDGMLVVTTEHIPGYEVRAVMGEVMGISARSFSPFISGLRSLRDGRGVTPELRVNLLTEGRREAVERMIDDAGYRGANAVLAMRFDHRQATENWTEICAYGTAVWAVPLGVTASAGAPARTGRPSPHAQRPTSLASTPQTARQGPPDEGPMPV